MACESLSAYPPASVRNVLLMLFAETACALTAQCWTRILHDLISLMQVSDSFGMKMISCDSVWMRNLFPNHSDSSPFECATESFKLNGKWRGIIRNDFAIKRIQTKWEICSDRCGIIRNKLETSIRTEKEWIVIGRSHLDFHYEWVRASETDFACIHNRSEWIGDIRIETESIFIPKLAAGIYLAVCQCRNTVMRLSMW